MTPPGAAPIDGGVTVGQDALDAELARVLEAYVADVESGRPVDPERLLSDHPAIAGRLQCCLASLRFLGDATISLGGAPAPDPSRELPATLGPTLGDYRIIRELGRGGMGIVYEAEQLSLGRRVALKVLPFAAVLDQKQIQRFKNEAHAAAQLHHTNIVPVFAVGAERGVHFYVMQYIEGQSLSNVIKELRTVAGLAPEGQGGEIGPVSELSKGFASGWFEPERKPRQAAPAERASPDAATAARTAPRESSAARTLESVTPGTSTRTPAFFRSVAGLGAQAAEALEHAHSLGIVHRDVKPGNLLLDLRGNLWVTDFGLARCQTGASLTMSGDLLGTLQYMSPEQALAKRVTVDHRTDIYSLGVTLYEILTLEPVFSGRDRQELLRKIAFEEPRSPRRLNKAIPLDLETIVLKAVTKDPGGRYASARHMAEDLKSFLGDQPIQARRMTILQRGARWSRRRKAGVSASAAILILLAVTGLLGYGSYREARWAAYREKVERAAAAIGLAQTSVGALYNESSRMLEFNEYSLRMLRAEGLEGMLEPLREAAAELEEAQEIFPGRPDASYHRARALLLLEKKDEAVKDLERALAADRDFAPALALLAALAESSAADVGSNGKKDKARVEKVLSGDWARTLLAIHRAVARKEWKAAAEGYGKLIGLEERGRELYLASGIESRLGRGVALFGAKDYMGAAIDFAGAKARWPASLVPDLLLGNALCSLGEEERAENVFLDAYERAPFKDEVVYVVMRLYATYEQSKELLEKALSWAEKIDREDLRERNKAVYYGHLGRAEEAVDAARKAIRLNPSDARSHSLLGMILRFTGKLDEAERHVLDAVSVDTGDAESCWLLGWFYSDRGMNLDAAAAGREAHRRNPKDLHQYVVVARWLCYAGETEEARLVLEEILRENPRSTWALEHLGQTFAQDGKYEEALKIYDRALEIDPECSATNNSRGRTLRLLGRLEEAEAQIRKAIQYAPFNVAAHEQLVWTLLRAKKYADAAEAARNGLRNLDVFAPFHTGRGQALEGLDDLKEALRAYSKAVELNLDRTGLTPYDRAVSILSAHPELAPEAPVLAAAIQRVLETKDLHAGVPRLARAVAPKLEEAARKALLAKLLDRARREAGRSGRKDPAALALLAEVQFDGGAHAEAVITLEEAVRLPDAPAALEGRLDAYRGSLLPALASFASIDAILPSLSREALVPGGSVWRFFRGKAEPPGDRGAWTKAGYDDSSSWEEGPSGFGFADEDDRTILGDMEGKYTTVYVRKTFPRPDPSRCGALVLSARADDGFVAYLNGEEIGRRRAGASGSLLPFDARAEKWADEPLAGEEISIPLDRLLPGDNCLAIQGLNHGLESSDFSLIPVLEAEVLLDPDRRAAVLERFRSASGPPAHLAYLEGSLLAKAGEQTKAAEAFRRAASLEPDAPEPLLRAAESIRAGGDPRAAVDLLEKALASRKGESGEIRDLWTVISFRDLKSPPGEMLAALPAGPAGADHRWLLERLAAGGAIRIDCGSEVEERDAGGKLWGKDRFHLGGRGPRAAGIEAYATGPGGSYRTERTFIENAVHPPTYRIPLPEGEYRITIHFAETFYRAARRKFDVRIEGTVVLDGHEPLSKGFGTEHRETFTAKVTDGALDIEFARKHKDPSVSAIEIERAS